MVAILFLVNLRSSFGTTSLVTLTPFEAIYISCGNITIMRPPSFRNPYLLGLVLYVLSLVWLNSSPCSADIGPLLISPILFLAVRFVINRHFGTDDLVVMGLFILTIVAVVFLLSHANCTPSLQNPAKTSWLEGCVEAHALGCRLAEFETPVPLLQACRLAFENMNLTPSDCRALCCGPIS